MRLVGIDESDHRSYDPEVRLSKEEAIANGVPVFWSGEQCRANHIAHRYVSSNECVVCKRSRNRANKTRRLAARSAEEARSAGISIDARRSAEELRERRRIDRELSGYFE